MVKTAPHNAVVKAAPYNAVVKAAPHNAVLKAAPRNAVLKAAPYNAVGKAAPYNAVVKALIRHRNKAIFSLSLYVVGVGFRCDVLKPTRSRCCYGAGLGVGGSCALAKGRPRRDSCNVFTKTMRVRKRANMLNHNRCTLAPTCVWFEDNAFTFGQAWTKRANDLRVQSCSSTVVGF